MSERGADGSAGDADYGTIGGGYATYRQPDARIEQAITAALGGARTVVNVGAGAGSYESATLEVTAVEPSASMRAQRPAHLSAAVDAVAENLPFGDDVFDAAMTTFSVHQWSDFKAGLREMRRVARGPVVVLTCDPDLVRDFWLYEYAPEVLDTEARRYPVIADLTETLGGHTTVTRVPIPVDCTDGFNEAYYARPEMLLDPGARQACSAWSFVDEQSRERFAADLRGDLDSGAWDARFGALRQQPFYDGSLVVIRSVPA
ncbi:methyltransferase family protein [Streptomyces sp. 1114.5]|uniref:class I SAM-dependent methyltransferase n=1 Tax=unclassified Streptomyces TaxID=2593676 RepID=UPI000BC75A53|nr:MULTISPECIES: class I SAM-dependent methyltransferase [unclassified Streptomyces]RKT09643.1 methyltransferase family protein [Streptomyces sp. 1114.5]SOB89040.1 Methyltransferase domain-containing protein [Streptomyces sp. 1331.2]